MELEETVKSVYIPSGWSIELFNNTDFKGKK